MKKEKIGFIAQCIITLFGLCISLFFLIGIIIANDYVDKDSLIYEECTFINYEFKNGKSPMYYIYVEEYDRYLKIDNIVINKVKEDLLDSINQGDKVIVSIDEDKDIYSILYNNEYILSYDDYLDKHNRNNTIGIVMLSIFSIMCSGIFVSEIKHYKKTGECLPF